jgi:hypothetical protein
MAHDLDKNAVLLFISQRFEVIDSSSPYSGFIYFELVQRLAFVTDFLS